MMLAAPVADHLGIQVWWWIGGITCIVMGLAGFLIPAVLKIEEDATHSALVPEVVPAD
jgi:hypothetical protein